MQNQGSGMAGGVSLFVPGSGGGNWWPAVLGQPASSGSQNNMRYAYFPQINRLAVDAGGSIAIYDTLNHQIGGFSQQQAYDGSITLTSQFGMVLLATLPRVSTEDPLAQGPVPAPAAPVTPAPAVDVGEKVEPAQSPSPAPAGQGGDTNETDILTMIEKLGDLHEKGVLSDEEFSNKKMELLSRL
jgi:hypothetical protein